MQLKGGGLHCNIDTGLRFQNTYVRIKRDNGDVAVVGLFCIFIRKVADPKHVECYDQFSSHLIHFGAGVKLETITCDEYGGNGKQCALSIIIVNYNTKDLLGQCVNSILENAPSCSFEVIVVDNASHDGSPEYIRDNYKNIKLIANDANVGFSAGNNIGITASVGNYVLLLNSDTIVMPRALDNLVDYLDQNSSVAAIGPMLLNEDMTIQRSWFDFPSIAKTMSHILGLSPIIFAFAGSRYVAPVLSALGIEPAFLKQGFCESSRVDYLMFACVLVRRSVFEEIGLLDEGLYFYHEDYEFGYRMFSHGMQMCYYPNAKVIHFGGGTSSKYLLKTYREYYRGLFYVYEKHRGMLSNILFRMSVALCFTFRSIIWFFGGYHRVQKRGDYAEDSSLEGREIPRQTEFLGTYIGIIKDSVFEKRAAKKVKSMPRR